MRIPQEERRGPGSRVNVAIPVRARWFDGELSGQMVEAGGVTVNVGPSGLLVSLERLPEVGTMLLLTVGQQAAPPRKRWGKKSAAPVSLKAIALWEEEREGTLVAALELDFTGSEATEQMRYWMDQVYEPAAIASLEEAEALVS